MGSAIPIVSATPKNLLTENPQQKSPPGNRSLKQWDAHGLYFEGSEIAVDPTHALFLTVAPGEPCRAPLPDNLRTLFRPVGVLAAPTGALSWG